jgi:putative restriction endonuclease
MTSKLDEAATKVKKAYTAYLKSANPGTSNKASSYVRALDLLGQMLDAEPYGFEDCRELWKVESLQRLQELHGRAAEEKNKGEASVWNVEGIAPSYLRDGFCSAALRSYQEFLVEYRHAQELLAVFEDHQGNEDELPGKFDQNLNYPDYLLEGLGMQEGRDVVRAVRTRANQQIFRSVVFQIYQQTCCITGLDLPAVNRASHIVGWAEDKSTRLDPRNGLCLSATYDAAFDRHLLSLDDDYRIILSRDLKEHYTGESVRAHFQNREGDQICLPDAYRPLPSYLERHRSKGRF